MTFRTDNHRGFTLLEILVVLVVIVLIAGIAITRVGKMFRVEVRQSASKMSSTIKYLYNKSATENRTIRLGFDLENSSYWAEATSDKFLLNPKDQRTEEEKKKAIEEEKNKEIEAGAEKTKEAVEDEDKGGIDFLKDDKKESDIEDEKPVKPKQAEFGAMDESILSEQVLPASVRFKDIQVSHINEPVTEGKVYIYFFPNGSVEPAVINLRNEDDTRVFSLKISPLTGVVDVQGDYRELER